jgi:hypothetical protein
MYFQAHGICQQKQPVAVVPDSVSTDYSELDFNSDGTYINSNKFTVTSSGTWSRTLVDSGYGTSWITSATPTFGSSGGTETIAVSVNNGSDRQCILRITVGSVHVDVTIYQAGVI